MTRRARHLRPAHHQVPLTILLLSHRHRRILRSNQNIKESDQAACVQCRLRQRAVSTYNLDLIYVDDNTDDGDAFYVGASAIQRIKALGGISTAFRVNSSFALEDEIPGNVIGDGALFTAEISATPKGSDDIAYFNPFISVGNFTQAGREPIVGGPLANTGILFASPNLSTYGSEIRNFVDDTVGFATGYQAFWDNKRRNLIIEFAGREDYGGAGEGIDSLSIGFQLQQAVGQHVQLQLEAFYTVNDDLPDGSGARFEVLIVY